MSQYSPISPVFPTVYMKFNTEQNVLVCCHILYIVYVLAMRDESTMVNRKKIQILYYCFTSQYMIQQSI